MRLSEAMIPAALIRRYKRFLADVRLQDERIITVHCPNTGSMRNCVVEESPCWISDSCNDKRKYRHTLELVTTTTGHLASVNTGRANKLVAEALRESKFPAFAGYGNILPEQKYGEEGSRVDFLLEGHASGKPCYLEVKSVTLGETKGRGFFPDAVSERASRHIRELLKVRESGKRAALIFCVQHNGIDTVSPADHIDPQYGALLREAVSKGLEVQAWKCIVSPQEISIQSEVPVLL